MKLKNKFFAIVLLVVLIAGILISPVSADYWSGTQTSINVSMWRDMTNNVTNIRDSMIPANLSKAITASTANITALSGNGTVVMDGGTISPYYNLTTSYAQVVVAPQSLNFTTPGAGTYLVEADLRGNVSIATYASTLGTNYTEYALCDANGTTIIANSERMGARVTDNINFTATSRHFTWIYSNSTGASEVGICGKISNLQAGRVGIASDSIGRSVLTWVRLA